MTRSYVTRCVYCAGNIFEDGAHATIEAQLWCEQHRAPQDVETLRAERDAAVQRAERAEAVILLLRVDDPKYDATDGAHPAWWRGHDHAARRFEERFGEVVAQRIDAEANLRALRDATRRLLETLRCQIVGCERVSTKRVHCAAWQADYCDEHAETWRNPTDAPWAAAVRELAKVLDDDAAVARKGGGT